MNSLIKYSLSHLYRIIKVYALLALLGALGVVMVQVVSGLKLQPKDQEALTYHIFVEASILLVNLVVILGTVPHLIEEIKSVVTTWRHVQAQFDKQIGHLAEEIIPPEITSRLKS